MIKDQNLPNKKTKNKKDLKKHSQTAITITDHNPPIQTFFADHQQIGQNYKIIHQIDIVDEIAVINSEIEITTNKTNEETFLNHHIKITHNIWKNKTKTIEVVHQYIKYK